MDKYTLGNGTILKTVNRGMEHKYGQMGAFTKDFGVMIRQMGMAAL